MSDAPISREFALRIGLAARLLPDRDPAGLLRLLDAAVGLPLTRKKLQGLGVAQLQAAGGTLAGLDVGLLGQLAACLNGPLPQDDDPGVPVPEPYADGDLPGSIRVACASDSAAQLDGHFGACRRFLVYQVSAAEARLIDVRTPSDSGAEDDKNAYRARLIADCQLLYVMSIGGPAAAKVVKAGVHPVKFPAGGAARAHVESLMPVLGSAPPPWLAKVMGQAAEQRVRFERADPA